MFKVEFNTLYTNYINNFILLSKNLLIIIYLQKARDIYFKKLLFFI